MSIVHVQSGTDPEYITDMIEQGLRTGSIIWVWGWPRQYYLGVGGRGSESKG